jgi:hypothetical protein
MILDQIVENTIDLDPEYQRGTRMVLPKQDDTHWRSYCNGRGGLVCQFFLTFLTYLTYSRPETKQIGLIDSILRNYYIPPIIFGT